MHPMLIVAAMLAALSCRTVAAEYPDHPLRAIVPFSAGGPNDTMARIVSPMLSKALGQQVIVENRPGADARIGIEALARSQPDGYTILFSAGAVALIPALRRNVPYDPVRDVLPVAELGNSPYGVGVHPRVPARNLAELIQLARRNPGRLNAELSRIVTLPETAKRFAALGINPSTKSVEESMRWHLAELAKWKDVVARAKIPLEN